MRYSFYQIAWIVIIYAFLGWCTEVAYAGVKRGKFVNRGFLNGPVCPIYGFGVLSVVLVLEPFKENTILLFLGSMLFCSVLEFIAGYAMERIFNDKWWDYSDNPFNIKGYVCLEFSLMWGLACVLVIDSVHPHIMNFINRIPYSVGIWMIAVLCALFAADLALTLIELLKLPKRFRAIEELERALTSVSDNIGEKIIYAGVEHGMEYAKAYEEKHPEAAERGREKVQGVLEKRAEISEHTREKELAFNAAVKEKREELDKMLRRGIVHERIIRAYPQLLKGEHNGKNFRKFRTHKEKKK